MKIVRYTGKRYCLQCETITDTSLIYLDCYLKAGKCINCGSEFINRSVLLDVYVKNYFERFLTKPYRVLEQFSDLPMSRQKHMRVSCELMKSVLEFPVRETANLKQILGKPPI